MGERRMLIVPAELAKKIDDNRGDMSQAEFIDLLIDSQLKEKEETKTQQYATKEEMRSFEEDTKNIPKNLSRSDLFPSILNPFHAAILNDEGAINSLFGSGYARLG